MIARYAITHRIRFDYDSPVHSEVMVLHLCPVRDRVQVVNNFSVHTDPDGSLFEFVDPFGNTGHFLNRAGAHERLEIVTRSNVEVGAVIRRSGPAGHRWVGSPARRGQRHGSLADAAPERLRSFLADSRTVHCPTRSRAGRRPARARRASSARSSTGYSSTFRAAPLQSPRSRRYSKRGRGVCQDYAHVMASILRKWGIPCRYVSGYLAPGRRGRGERREPRMGGRLVPRGRLDRLRPDQRYRRGRTTRPGGSRAGLCGRSHRPGACSTAPPALRWRRR